MVTSAIDGDYLSTLAVAQPQSGKKRAELGQEDFLNLMITQFRNQDPFKPLDADAMLGQLAQFGTVAGLNDVKNQIESLSSSLLSDQSLQATALVGRNVLVASQQVVLQDAAGALGGVLVPAGAQLVTARILDGAGRLLDVVELGTPPPGMAHFVWDGIGSDGTPAPAGTYIVQADAVVNGAATALETFAAAPVSSVSLGRAGEGLTLNLGGLGAYGFDAVREVFD
jgi:flagellar basal-body rod modification protein FlgD